jgi:hypothetical protein
MHDMGSEQMMAGGGIVAFDDNQNQPVRLGMDGNTDEYPIFNLGDAISNVGSWMGKNWEKNKQIREGTYNAPNPVSQGAVANRDAYRSAPAVPAITPEMQAEIDKQSAANPPGGQKAPGGVGTPPAVAPGAPAGAPAGGPGIGNPPASNAAQAPTQAGIGAPTQRVDRFAGLGDTQDAFDQKVADEKRAATGDFLMNMGLKMMTTVGPLGKAVGEGGMAGLPGLAASRKSINELEKNRNDYRLNMARYQTAADEGDQDLALKYKTLAEQSVYHSGLVAADMIKSNAYAAGVGSKSDIRQDKLNEAILKGATDLHAKNMTNPLFATKFAKMDPASQQQYFAGLRNQASALAGQEVKGDLGSGFSMDAIDAAIARKEKSKS